LFINIEKLKEEISEGIKDIESTATGEEATSPIHNETLEDIKAAKKLYDSITAKQNLASEVLTTTINNKPGYFGGFYICDRCPRPLDRVARLRCRRQIEVRHAEQGETPAHNKAASAVSGL
jgi:hypothetical protein